MRQKSDLAPSIVVTGGAGFIGSCLIRYLNDQGHSSIVIVDDLGKGEKWQNLVGKTFHTIVSRYELKEWLRGREKEISAFIHLGACSSTVETDADYLLNNNFRFSVDLVDYALTHGQRFIYASSAATYGDGRCGFEDNEAEIEQLKPLNMYGYSKQLFDLWIKQQGLLKDVVGLKYFNVFGPNEWHKGRMASAILHMLPKIQQEGVVRLFQSNDPAQFGDGEQKRDFIYVKDAVRMTCAFLHHKAGGLYNIGTGEANSWNRLANALFRAIEKPANIEYIPMPADLIGKYQNYTRATMDKTKQVLGDAAACMPLEQSVEDYVRNHLLSGTRW